MDSVNDEYTGKRSPMFMWKEYRDVWKNGDISENEGIGAR